MVKNLDLVNDKKQGKKKIFSSLTSDRQNHLEWVQIATGKVIVATAERGWLYSPKSKEERFSQPMTGAGNISTTRKLLDTVIAAAKYAIESNLQPPKLTPTSRG